MKKALFLYCYCDCLWLFINTNICVEFYDIFSLIMSSAITFKTIFNNLSEATFFNISNIINKINLLLTQIYFLPKRYITVFITAALITRVIKLGYLT